MGLELGGSKRNLATAKRLRRELTLPEIILWRELRKLDVRFRKQVPADPYVLDFYCARARLVIEVDGEAHDRGDRPVIDERRDVWLAAKDIRTFADQRHGRPAQSRWRDAAYPHGTQRPRKRPLHHRLAPAVPLPR